MARNKSDSFGNRVEHWQTMLGAFDLNADVLAPARPQRDALEAVLEQVWESKETQLQYVGLKQQASKVLLRMMAAGEEAARCLRRAVEANLGTDSEILAQFELTPRRPRKRKLPEIEEPAPQEPPGGESPEPLPE
jgi:hypothetical protein